MRACAAYILPRAPLRSAVASSVTQGATPPVVDGFLRNSRSAIV